MTDVVPVVDGRAHADDPQEAARLKALASYEILGTPPEPSFDDLAQAAADVCGTPMALVSLVDGERVWFKARIGTAVEQIPRLAAFCSYVIEQDETLVVADAAQDERFAVGPIAPDAPKIGFYAGAPLITGHGQRLGSLCVLDNEPRPAGLTKVQTRVLRTLAGRVVAEMELRRISRERADVVRQLTGDIEVRKAAYAASLKTEAQLRHLAQSELVGIAYGDVRLPLAYANDALLQMLGYSRADLIAGKLDWPGLTPPDWLPLDREKLELAKRTGFVSAYEKEYLHKDGHRVPVLVGYSLTDNTHVSSVVFVLDLSEQKKKEQQLRDSEARLQLALEIGSMGTFEWNVQANRVDWSPGHFTLLGYRIDEVPPSYQAWASRVHPEDLPRTEASMADAVRRRDDFLAEYRIVRPDGEITWIAARARFDFDADGAPVRMVGILRDITEAKAAAAELADQEERLRLMVDGVQDYAILMLDPNGQVASWNAGAERLIGYRASDVIGRPFAMFFRPEDVDAGLPKQLLAEAAEHGRVIHDGLQIRQDDSPFYVHVTLTALRDAEGCLRGFSNITRDVTHRALAEAELRRANDDLLRVSRLSAMGAMASTLAHELNQPLASIANYLSAIRRLLEKKGITTSCCSMRLRRPRRTRCTPARSSDGSDASRRRAKCPAGRRLSA